MNETPSTQAVQKHLSHASHSITSAAAHCMHGAPLQSLLIAASMGASIATLVSLLMHSRKH
jgi:hypothetical protein